LLEQLGLRPSARAVIDAVVAIVMGIWAILAQSWVPVGIAIAIVLFLTLRGARQPKLMALPQESPGGVNLGNTASASAPIAWDFEAPSNDRGFMIGLYRNFKGEIRVLAINLRGTNVTGADKDG
jgi:hypothetical protein